MKMIKLSALALATVFLTASCENGAQHEETTDTTVTSPMEPAMDTDTPMNGRETSDNTGNPANNTGNPANGNMANDQNSSGNMPQQGDTYQPDKAVGDDKTDLAKSPSTGHPGDNPPRKPGGSPNQ